MQRVRGRDRSIFLVTLEAIAASQSLMWIEELWRYPIKSLAGEPLKETMLGEQGVPGDRIVHVVDARGRVVTSRRRPKLLLMKGTIEDGEARIDGLRWDDPIVATRIEDAAGEGA